FILVFVIFATAMDPRGPSNLAPFAIGIAVVVIHFVGVPLTGASVNPARTLGPALVTGEWADHWIYWVGPLGGGAIAALT
ncbi:MAG: aquaporin, partial [Dehalococcoidia bacterium]|nr:aquaporin [Dehalococcoidia bacterium]